MPLNTNLLRPPAAIEFPDQVNRLAQFSQIQNAQNQNALAQYTLAAAQRGENVKSALDRAYLKAYNPQTGQIDPSRLRGAVIEAQIGSELPAIERSIAEVEKAQLARKKEFGEVVNQKLAQSKGLLANVNSDEGFLAWYDANNADPVLGEYFKSRGMNNEQARAALSAQLAQPGGLQRLIAISASSLDKLPETLENQQAQAVLGGRTPTQPMAARTTNNTAPTAPQTQPVASAMVAPVQTAAVPAPAVTAMPAVSGLQGELSAVNNEIARLQSSGSAGLGAVQKRIQALEEQKAKLFTAITQERQADTSAQQAKLAAERLAFEQSTAADFRSSPSGVVRIDKITGETRIVKDANGKPVMDVAAAQAAEAARHARVIESQGAARIGQENQRIALQRQADARAEYQAKQPKFDASAGGFVYAPTPENPQGKFVAVTGIEGKAPNEAQGNAIAYGVRMDGANKILESLEGKGVTSGGKIKGFVSGTLEALVPYQGEKLAAGAESFLRPFLSSENQNNYEQAKENFITAVLRKESGASISPAEFAREERKYFPQVGDNDSTIKQKQDARRLAISAIRQVAGPFAKNIDAISSGAAGGPASGAATGADPLGLFGKK